MQLFPNIETAVVTEGFLIMMTILGYFLLSGSVAETGDSTPLDVFIIVMAVLGGVLHAGLHTAGKQVGHPPVGRRGRTGMTHTQVVGLTVRRIPLVYKH